MDADSDTLIPMVISFATISFAQEIRTDYDRNPNLSQVQNIFVREDPDKGRWIDRMTSAISVVLVAA